jgi:iron complex transport system substrate-binding protein
MKIKAVRLAGLLLALILISTGAATAQKPLEIRYANGFTVESLNGLPLVTVRPSWQDGGAAFRYLLVPRNRAVPEGHPPAQVIRVPVRRVVSFSTTHLAYLDAAGLVDRLVGLGEFRYVNTPSVRRRIAAHELEEVGQYTRLRMETLLELAPELALVQASGMSYDLHPKLLEAGLSTVVFIDHLETHPLGRLEWIKLLGLLFDRRAHAATCFAETAAHYREMADRARRAETRPGVITGAPFQGQWWVARGDSFLARFIADAGGDYVWSDRPGSGSLALDIEAVYERALAADVWLNTSTWKTVAEAEAADPRFATLPALRNDRVFNNNKRLNAEGGNDYWESGMLRPDVVLADLITILHPELLPGRELVYYRQLAR